MKFLVAVALLLSQMISHPAQAQLRLDCADFTPKTLTLVKPEPPVDPCSNQGTSLVVLTDTRVLYTCENGQTVQRYDVSMGRGGIDKSVEGDLRTPIGTYRLGSPVPHARFGVFIPVAYPTAAQRAQGMTGSDIGIHGPERVFACAGALNVVPNWTQGCLAVADDHFIVEIAEFVKAHSPMVVRILK